MKIIHNFEESNLPEWVKYWKNDSPSSYINSRSKEYAIYTLLKRVIPYVGDGLKNGQREALYILRSKPDNKEVKTISLAGEMISSELYLHGDVSATDSISLLAAPFKNNVPLITGIGGFGTRVNPDSFGAPRYTYVKKNSASNNLLYIDSDVVPMVENHDGSNIEPSYFLPIVPLILLNGAKGVGTAWNTTIFPRSLKDIINATKCAIEGKKIPTLPPKYDYLNIDVKKIEGNSYEFAGKVTIDDTSTATIIEIPPEVTLEKMREKLFRLVEEDKINSFEDNSQKKISIKLKFKRGSLKDWTEQDIIDYIGLTSKASENFVVLNWDKKSIVQYDSAEKIVEDFVKWRFKGYVDRYEKMKNDSSYELKFWLGMKDCYDDGLPERLKSKKDKKDLSLDISNIVLKHELSDEQIDKIASLPSYRWAKDGYKQVLDKIKELKNSIKEYDSYLKDDSKIKSKWIEELDEIKKLKF